MVTTQVTNDASDISECHLLMAN